MFSDRFFLDISPHRKELSTNVLESFLDEMNFTGSTFEMALRTFLSSFRLPGEAQQIDRIL